MKRVMEQLTCDECGVRETKLINPTEFGASDPFAKWITNCNNELDFCGAGCAAKYFTIKKEFKG